MSWESRCAFLKISIIAMLGTNDFKCCFAKNAVEVARGMFALMGFENRGVQLISL